MKDLYLMRHGQTLFNVRRKIQGWCDSPLTPLGIEQAKAAKKILADIHFDHYYCSTAERSNDTLELIIGPDQPYTRLKGLRERGFGTFESESEDLNPAIELYDAYFVPAGGESDQQVRDRLYQTLNEIMSKNDHQTVLAVSHAGACMNFFSIFEDRQKIKALGGITNCCIFHYTYENGVFHFVELIHSYKAQ